MDLELERPSRPKKGEPILLEAKNPEGVKLSGLNVFIAESSTSRFVPLSMTLQGDVWSAEYMPEEVEKEEEERDPMAQYFFAVAMGSGIEINVGNEERPLAFQLPGTRKGGGGGDLGDLDELDHKPGLRGVLPPWAWWAIGGGSAVVVTSIILGVVLSGGGGGDRGSGNLQVNVVFQ